jgi:hypothetical protein
MNEPRRYRLGNQPEVYEVSEDYLGWKPVGFKDWNDTIRDEDGCYRGPRPFPINLVNPDGSLTVSIILHIPCTEEALPSFSRTQAEDWHDFAVVSLEETPLELFIIPLH